MKRNILIVLAGFAAFIVAGVTIPILQMAVTGLMPGRSPDQEGKLEPSSEDRLKAIADKETKAEVKTETVAKAEPAAETTTQASTAPAPTGEPMTPHPVAPPPPVPTSGPGNFDAPQPYYPPAGATGPGNL
jgi:hypothetical protein